MQDFKFKLRKPFSTNRGAKQVHERKPFTIAGCKESFRKMKNKFGSESSLHFIFASVLFHHLSRKAEGYGPQKP